ncbi:MAG: hypothetical protein FVQ80_11045 [Planctomycetes bacterium]|nr:hypothetical protein [Planctomycetota bacterium]
MAAIGFPISGIDKGRAIPEEDLSTTPDCNNARPYDTIDKRGRGGQRPPFDKAYSEQIGGSPGPIVAITQVTVVS